MGANLACYYYADLTGYKYFAAQESRTASPSLAIKVTEETNLTQKIKYVKYAKCNDEETFHSKANEVLIGLSIEQLQDVYNGYEAVISLVVDDYAVNMRIICISG